jgi:uncharacterized membrane protein
VDQDRRTDHLIALAKGVSWRIFGSLTTAIIVYVITGKLDLALGVGAFEVVSKIALYYLHERLWVVLMRAWRARADRH